MDMQALSNSGEHYVTQQQDCIDTVPNTANRASSCLNTRSGCLVYGNIYVPVDCIYYTSVYVLPDLQKQMW